MGTKSIQLLDADSLSFFDGVNFSNQSNDDVSAGSIPNQKLKFKYDNSSDFPAAPVSCTTWGEIQNPLFQIAGLFFIVAFLLPHRLPFGTLVSRLLLCLGFLMFVIWSGLYVCAIDIFCWNALFILINLVHIIYLSYVSIPPRLPDNLKDLYDKVFLPLHVLKKHFREITHDGVVSVLKKGQKYSDMNATLCNQRLSVLLKGRLMVTFQNTFLHWIEANQFIDSPEWIYCNSYKDTYPLFQVSITAVEDSVYLCWSRANLLEKLESHSYLQTLMDNLIGKDVTQKLYSVSKSRLAETKKRSVQESPMNAASSMYPRSISMVGLNAEASRIPRTKSWKNIKIKRKKFCCNSENKDCCRLLDHYTPEKRNQRKSCFERISFSDLKKLKQEKSNSSDLDETIV